MVGGAAIVLLVLGVLYMNIVFKRKTAELEKKLKDDRPRL